MKSLLPRRIFPAMVMALGIIVLTSTPLLADTGEPLVFGTGWLMLVGLIPVIGIEALVLRRGLRLEWRDTLDVAAFTNIASLLPLSVAFFFLAVGPRFPYDATQTYVFVAVLVTLVPLFFVSWWVEYWVARWMLRPERPGSGEPSSKPAAAGSGPLSSTLGSPIRLIRGTFEANLAIGVFIATLEIPTQSDVFGSFTPFVVLFGLTAAIVAEILVIRWRLRLGWWGALRVIAISKLVSAIVAILVWVLYEFAAERLPGGRFAFIDDRLEFFVPVLLFLDFWLVEYRVACRLLRPELSRGSTVCTGGYLLKQMFYANLASYLFLVMSLGVFSMEGIITAPHAGSNQAAAVGSLLTIDTAEVTYSSTYTKGYSPSLAALDGKPSGEPTAESAELIDEVLGRGEKAGYRFVYKAAPDADGVIRHYTIVARPLKHPGGGNSYFTDETGVIRMTTEDRDATATDPPLAG